MEEQTTSYEHDLEQAYLQISELIARSRNGVISVDDIARNMRLSTRKVSRMVDGLVRSRKLFIDRDIVAVSPNDLENIIESRSTHGSEVAARTSARGKNSSSTDEESSSDSPKEKQKEQPLNVSKDALTDHSAQKKNDAFGYADYAHAIVDFLSSKSAEPPFAIAVTGPWGIGKTTILSWIREEMRDKNYSTVWFQAWRHNAREAIWAAFARQIIEEAISKRPWWTAKLYWKRFLDENQWLRLAGWGVATVILALVLLELARRVGMWTPDVGLLSSSITSFIIGGGLAGLVTAFRSPALEIRKSTKGPDYLTALGFKAAFERDLRRVLEVVASEKPLVIFIDDLDRALPPAPAEVIEAVNHLFGEKRCLFVVGLDMDVVAASLESRYKDVARSMRLRGTGRGVYGRDFLDKLFQVTLNLPSLDATSSAIYARQLLQSHEKELTSDVRLRPADAAGEREPSATMHQDEFVEEFDESREVREAVESALPLIDGNPRRIKRFINNFRLMSFIANRRNKLADDKIDLVLLAVFAAVQIDIPGFARLIAHTELHGEFRDLVEALVSAESRSDKSKLNELRELLGLSDRHVSESSLMLLELLAHTPNLHEYVSLGHDVAGE